MRSTAKMMIGVVASLAVLMSSTATSAPDAGRSQPIAAHVVPAASAWMMLSLLGPAQAIALGGATTATQSEGEPPLPPPAARSGRLPLPAAGVFFLWALIALRLATLDHHHDRFANSPS